MNLQDFLQVAPADLAEHIIPPTRVLQAAMVSKVLWKILAKMKCLVDVQPGKSIRQAYAAVDTTNAERRALVRLFLGKSLGMSMADFHIRSLTVHGMVIGNVATLTATLANSTRLEVLNLHNNHIDEDLICDVFAAIPSSVRILKLTRQWINRSAVTPLCALLARLVLLADLDLSENYLNSQGMEALTSSIVSAHLTHVSLGFNHLTSRFWNEHPHLGFERFVLHKLDLQNNKLQSVFCDSIYSCVRGSAAVLTSLDMSYNDLRLVGISYLSISLQHCKVLRHLNVAGNTCGDPGFALLLAALKPHVPGNEEEPGIPLQSLDVAHNQLSCVSARLFNRWMAGSEPLQHSLCSVSFSYNDLHDVGAQLIIEALAPCAMTKLGLAQCLMGDTAGLCLADAMRHWPALAPLDVHGNRLCPSTLLLIARALRENKSHGKQMLFFGNWFMQESTQELEEILLASPHATADLMRAEDILAAQVRE
jgi:Ran GTPase-activating protein (RanGAP) involved in mRNA processing and transport